jgi:hypothetical protein
MRRDDGRGCRMALLNSPFERMGSRDGFCLLDNGEVTQHASDHYEGNGAERDPAGDGKIRSVRFSHANTAATGLPLTP